MVRWLWSRLFMRANEVCVFIPAGWMMEDTKLHLKSVSQSPLKSIKLLLQHNWRSLFVDFTWSICVSVSWQFSHVHCSIWTVLVQWLETTLQVIFPTFCLYWRVPPAEEPRWDLNWGCYLTVSLTVFLSPSLALIIRSIHVSGHETAECGWRVSAESWWSTEAEEAAAARQWNVFLLNIFIHLSCYALL